jgi:S-formylglutathione hydrolase FrmB
VSGHDGRDLGNAAEGDCVISGRTRKWRWVVALAATLTAIPATAVAGTPPAGAPPQPGVTAPVSDGSHVDHVVPVDARRSTIYVYSAAMNRTIALEVMRPADTAVPAPTLYLLDGAEDGVAPGGTVTSWETKTDLINFTADKHVNVVTVLDGRYSYYTDWLHDDPVLGRNKWTTFLTRELPPLIDAELHTTGRNAIAGVSMSATSVLSLAESARGLYRSVGSFSGCAETSVDPGRRYVQAVVLSGGGDPWNMWGPDGGPEWSANDPSTDAGLAALRGVNLVITAGTGSGGGEGGAPGGLLESVVYRCTLQLQSRMARLDIPAIFHYTPGGQHAWSYWQQSLHLAWPSIERSLHD